MLNLNKSENSTTIAVSQYEVIDGNEHLHCVDLPFGEETYQILVYDEEDCIVRFVINYTCCRGIYEYAGCGYIDPNDDDIDWGDVAGYVSSFIMAQKNLRNI